MERLKIILLFLVTLLPTTLSAQLGVTYDFAAVNADGLTLYYKIINETNKEVAFGINLKLGTVYFPFTKLHIPETVTYNGKTYTVTEMGPYAPRNLSNLVDLKFPNTLKHIRTINHLSFSHKLKKLLSQQV